MLRRGVAAIVRPAALLCAVQQRSRSDCLDTHTLSWSNGHEWVDVCGRSDWTNRLSDRCVLHQDLPVSDTDFRVALGPTLARLGVSPKLRHKMRLRSALPSMTTTTADAGPPGTFRPSETTRTASSSTTAETDPAQLHRQGAHHRTTGYSHEGASCQRSDGTHSAHSCYHGSFDNAKEGRSTQAPPPPAMHVSELCAVLRYVPETADRSERLSSLRRKRRQRQAGRIVAEKERRLKRDAAANATFTSRASAAIASQFGLSSSGSAPVQGAVKTASSMATRTPGPSVPLEASDPAVGSGSGETAQSAGEEARLAAMMAEEETIEELTNRVSIIVLPGRIITIHRGEVDFIAAIRKQWHDEYRCRTPMRFLNALVKHCARSFQRAAREEGELLDVMEVKFFSPSSVGSARNSKSPVAVVRRRLESLRVLSSAKAGITGGLYPKTWAGDVPDGRRMAPHRTGLLGVLLGRSSGSRRLAGAPANTNLRDLYGVSRRASVFCRVLLPMEATYAQLVAALGVDDDDVHVHHVRSHFATAQLLCEDARNGTQALLSLHFQQAANDLEEMMRFLTVFSSVFIPLEFITALYGMNVEWWPWMEDDTGFLKCVAIMSAAVSATVLWFRAKRFM